MTHQYDYDIIDGRKVPPLVVTEDYILSGIHKGTVHVEAGLFILEGILQGSLRIHDGVTVEIRGKQQGSVSLAANSSVSVSGAIDGSTSVSNHALLIVEPSGRLAGSLANNGRVIVRGVFGGALTGDGDLILEGDGYIKEPRIEGGINYYDW